MGYLPRRRAGRIQAQPYFRNCLFDGSLLGPNTTSCGGMVGNFNANFLCYFQSCLYAPEEQTVLDEGSAIFAVIGYPGGKIYTIGWDYWPGDSYYKRTLGDGDAQGVDAPAAMWALSPVTTAKKATIKCSTSETTIRCIIYLRQCLSMPSAPTSYCKVNASSAIHHQRNNGSNAFDHLFGGETINRHR